MSLPTRSIRKMSVPICQNRRLCGPLLLLLVAGLCGAACGTRDLDPGAIGTARYFGEILWEQPTRLMPPIRDRDGNVYIGMREQTTAGCVLAEAEVMVGFASGGWSGGCALREGTRRVHGWVDSAASEAWFWSGDALVAVTGENGSCKSILSTDPASNSDLNFVAVVPWVWDRPSRRTLLAMIQSPGDPRPFHAVVDVGRKLYTDLRAFEPSNAENVVSVGTGGNRHRRTGVILVWYQVANSGRLEAIFLNENGVETARTSVQGLGNIVDGTQEQWQDAVVGFMAQAENGTAAALLRTGELLVVSPTDSSVHTFAPMTVDGPQLWDDTLWLTGNEGGTPMLAEIRGVGDVSSAVRWDASTAAAETLRGNLNVIDDRTSPRRLLQWQSPVTAIGSVPFVAPHNLMPYNQNAVGWVVAGPSFVTGFGTLCRSVAFVPMGVSYP
ncbi:MAG: hypothetical protein R3C68_00055 [Myxococcota bacterium]